MDDEENWNQTTKTASPRHKLSSGVQAFLDGLGLEIRDARLLTLALTHCSFSPCNNERLEFLGDAILNLAVARLLYEKLPDLPEGDLSRARANLVKQESLANIACDVGLQEVIRLGETEQTTGGNSRPSIMADALEAVVGAVFLDAGYDAADALVRRLYSSTEIHPSMHAIRKDAKTELQEWLQARRMQLPRYRIVHVDDTSHRLVFTVECEIEEHQLRVTGSGPSKRSGEQVAAATALEKLRLH